ncbi:hypothetical protein M7I_7617 [Glarea lozoyensis 74030]|uniref:Uncharacterized protein n=1 Tax=Glarea lozoyensis (strain ATCC 74030 / MF5533) TaxID=1104152 RepID=H0EXS8_GLAL7|nr:hypothetical protein M7I_7617 [Glarea lozoyensis 74030]
MMDSGTGTGYPRKISYKYFHSITRLSLLQGGQCDKICHFLLVENSWPWQRSYPLSLSNRADQETIHIPLKSLLKMQFFTTIQILALLTTSALAGTISPNARNALMERGGCEGNSK